MGHPEQCVCRGLRQLDSSDEPWYNSKAAIQLTGISLLPITTEHSALQYHYYAILVRCRNRKQAIEIFTLISITVDRELL